MFFLNFFFSSKIFTSLLFFASIKAKEFGLAFDFLRFYMTFTLVKMKKINLKLFKFLFSQKLQKVVN